MHKIDLSARIESLMYSNRMSCDMSESTPDKNRHGWQSDCNTLHHFNHEGGDRAMDENTFQTKLSELMQEISTLPQAEREKLTQLAQESQDRHAKLRKSVNDLQESLDYLRLAIKYMVFDLEATRRENSYLRKMLDKDTPTGDDDTPYGA
jgi:chromosome segregation ATPase